MTAYVIFQMDVTDEEQIVKYREKSGPSVAAAGGEYIARGGAVDVLEGDAPLPRNVIIRFPSMEAARAWYDGEAYREARALRDGAARALAYVVDGVD